MPTGRSRPIGDVREAGKMRVFEPPRRDERKAYDTDGLLTAASLDSHPGRVKLASLHIRRRGRLAMQLKRRMLLKALAGFSVWPALATAQAKIPIIGALGPGNEAVAL